LKRERRTCLLVINSLAGGGAERVFTTLVTDLARFRGECDFVVALLDDEEVEAYILPDWVKVYRVDSKASLNASVRRLCGLFRQLRPDVCISFLTRANFAAIVAGRLYGCKTIISERVNTTAHLAGRGKNAISRALVRILYPRADGIIAVSQGVKDTLVKDFFVSADRVTVIPNPFDIDRIATLALQPAPFEIAPGDWATMGRLVPTKNAALAIRAFVAASTKGRLFVLGDGPLRGELEALVRDLDASDRVRICGFVENPYAVLGRCDAYILPSEAEGFPNAMVEAMALGKPVVATDCPSGPSEIFETEAASDEPSRGRGGMLVKCGAVNIMAHAITALEDGDLRRDLGRLARERAMEFSVERTTLGFWQVITANFAAANRSSIP
jgi:glycosyltransferase involved in cell wall biosynthesis